MVEMYAGFSLISSGFAYATFCCTVALSVVAAFTSSYTEGIAVADRVLTILHTHHGIVGSSFCLKMLSISINYI